MRRFKANKPKEQRQFVPATVEGKPHAWGWDKYHEENSEVRKYYTSKRWHDLRAMILARFPLCCVCENEPAEEVHHILGGAKHPELFFVPSNLAPVSVECHRKVESAMKRNIKPEELFPENQRIKLEVKL